ncbi:MAG: hypothetical protein M1812_000266 [Candelaria pacifica]|nr:MAG: hypothetical protein M1812_000266 [Candelaria pacifica]
MKRRALVVLDASSDVVLGAAADEVVIVDDRLDVKLELIDDPTEVAEETADSPAVETGTTGTPPKFVPWVSVAPFWTEVRLPETPLLGMPVTAAVCEAEGAPVERAEVLLEAAFEADVVQYSGIEVTVTVTVAGSTQVNQVTCTFDTWC